VSVRRTLARVNGRWLSEEPKTKSSRRTVPLPLGLTTELSEHMSRQLEPGFTDLVFYNRDGGPSYERGIVHGAFQPALSVAGLPAEIRLYDLRHTHATLVAGVHPW
jgi:integrase